MAHRLFRLLAALLIACLVSRWAVAAELGEPRVASCLGQPLVANVELVALEDPATPVRASLASADVYRGAGIAVPPVLAGLHLSVMRRDGRQFLHLTTIGPVEADHLHVYLELADGGQQAVRLVTLWLAADPDPVPPPTVAEAVPAMWPDTAAGAGPVAPVRPASVPAPAAWKGHVPVHVAPVARVIRGTRPAKPAGATPAQPVAAHAVDAAPAKPPAPAAGAPMSRRPSPVVPRPAVVQRTAALSPAVAACPQHFSAAQLGVCTALDGKNALLRAEVGLLEGKVRALQAALAATPAAATAPKPGPAHTAAAKPVSAPVPPPAAEAKPNTAPAHPAATPPVRPAREPALGKAKRQPPPEHRTPWAWIAAGVALAAAAGAAVFAIRRQRGKPGKAPKTNKPEMEVVVTPRVMGDVKSRLM